MALRLLADLVWVCNILPMKEFYDLVIVSDDEMELDVILCIRLTW